jgi:SCP-2 sterol transfer family
VPYPFLSPEWIEAVRAVRDKYQEDAPPVPYKMKMNQVITDAPFGEGTIQIFVDTTDGQLVMDFGHLPDPEVTVTTDYATARNLLVDLDPQAAMQAFLGGKIKVVGDMMKIMQMQASPPDDLAKQVANEIRELTE